MSRNALSSPDCGWTSAKPSDTTDCSSSHGSEWVVVPVIIMTRAVVDILAENAGGAAATDAGDLGNALEVLNSVGGDTVSDVPVLAAPAGADVGECTLNRSWFWPRSGDCS